MVCGKLTNSLKHDQPNILSSQWEIILTADTSVKFEVVTKSLDCLLKKCWLPFFNNQYILFIPAEFMDLIRHQGISNIQNVEGNFRGSSFINQAERL